MSITPLMVSVEIDAVLPLEDVRVQLQSAFDNGAAGRFTIVRTRSPGYLVIFERSLEGEDEALLIKHMRAGRSGRKAVLDQLARELRLGSGDAIDDVAGCLEQDMYTAFPFGDGAVQALSEAVPA